MFFTQLFLISLFSAQAAFAYPFHDSAPGTIATRANSASRGDLRTLFNGHKRFKSKSKSQVAKLAAKQAPPFLYLGCADSRTPESSIFDAPLGTVFTHRNIANQFDTKDTNAYAVVSYGVAALGAQHVIIMGHYGCGGVAAAIAPPANVTAESPLNVVVKAISPIRKLYESSTREEIAAHRKENKGKQVKEPKIKDPVFRALVEENVKEGVKRVAESPLITQIYESIKSNKKGADGKETADVFIHGMVYDIETGDIHNLNVSVGPPGKKVPDVPFPSLKGGKSKN